MLRSEYEITLISQKFQEVGTNLKKYEVRNCNWICKLASVNYMIMFSKVSPILRIWGAKWYYVFIRK